MCSRDTLILKCVEEGFDAKHLKNILEIYDGIKQRLIAQQELKKKYEADDKVLRESGLKLQGTCQHEITKRYVAQYQNDLDCLICGATL